MDNLYTIMAVLITLAVAIGYINHRFIHIQTTIALMLGSLTISLISIFVSHLGSSALREHITIMVAHLHFHDLLINGMLSFLLFAGALSIETSRLKIYRWEIANLAIIGTLASALLVSLGIYWLFSALHRHMDFIYCLLFGSLISPTDPIAVLAIFKEVRTPSSLKTLVAGESLFNDGVGIVLFLTALYIASTDQAAAHWTTILSLFCQQALGGIAYGIGIGYLACRLMKPLQEQQIKILMSIAVVTGGYALAESLHISAPLAMVAAGILIGNHYRNSERNKQHQLIFSEFWSILDDILNAILFLIIGFEMLVLDITHFEFIISLATIPIVLLARYLVIAPAMVYFKKRNTSYPKKTVSILVWGGLRGALAIALALSLPPNKYRDIILMMTYAMVIFSIVVQGLTMKPLLKKCL